MINIHKVYLYSREDIEISEKRVRNFLFNFLKKEKIAFFENKKILIKPNLQSLLKAKIADRLDQVTLEIILENAYKAENLSPGAFQTFLTLFLGDKYDKHDVVESFHPRKKDIENLIRNNLPPTETEMLFSALEMAGFGGKISIEKSQNENSSLEFVNSHIFQCSTTQEKSIKLIKPKVIIVDGYIESVSEINVLLESLTNSGDQLVLICRGFHPDVLNTIKVNNDRKVICVYLVEVPFDLNGINSMVDMAVVCSCELISNNLGQLISSISVTNSVSVDEIILTKNKISIRKNSSQEYVKTHVSNLIKKMEERPEISEIFEKRIASLNARGVIIRIPDDRHFIEKSRNFDLCLRLIKSTMDYGILENGELSSTNHIASLFVNKAKKCLNELGNVFIE